MQTFSIWDNFLAFSCLIIFKVEPTIATHEQQQSSSSSKAHGKVPSANSRNNDEGEWHIGNCYVLVVNFR